MTKKLEEVLNLPENKKLASEEKKAKEKSETFLRDIAEFDKISAALPQVKGLGDLSDSEFDELADRATNAYDDLMDLGMNVEARYSGRIFEVAGNMLKSAIEAKAAKVDKKLRMIELQIKKAKLDQDAESDAAKGLNIPGEGYIVADRNSLLEKLKTMK